MKKILKIYKNEKFEKEVLENDLEQYDITKPDKSSSDFSSNYSRSSDNNTDEEEQNSSFDNNNDINNNNGGGDNNNDDNNNNGNNINKENEKIMITMENQIKNIIIINQKIRKII